MQNKNLRKALAVSMAIAMTGGLLAGCGNSSSGGSSNSGTTNIRCCSLQEKNSIWHTAQHG